MRLFFAILAGAVPVCAQTCTYTVTPLALTLPSTASTGRISVATDANCSWSALNNDRNLTWLHLDSATSQGTGNGAVGYSADANPTGAQRTGSITVAAATVSITQNAAACTYTLDRTSQNIAVGGGTGSFKVTTGCVWQPVSNNGSFITINTPNPVRTGTDTAVFTVAPNGCVAGRSGSITVNNTSPGTPPVFNVTQDGSSSNLTLSATSITAGPDASDGRVTVTTGLGCGWSAFSDVSWMRITSGATGSGNGAIAYHLLANTSAARTGYIHVGSLLLAVTQTASLPPAPTIASVNDAANYRADAVSPGEIVTIFGANMGPAKLVPLQVTGGSVTSLLAGTQVLFDNVPAPLIYTLSTQVSAVVPYGVAGKPSTQVQVIYNGLTSAAVTVPVQAAHPGIFSLDATGLGPGAILNQDNSINSGPNGAPRGSVVAIYATGGGVTSPALADGAVTGSNLPYLTAPVTVTIGGVDAKVVYAGGAPGSVAGLTQINAEIPAGAALGTSVPIVIHIGGYDSSPGVTLSVK